MPLIASLQITQHPTDLLVKSSIISNGYSQQDPLTFTCRASNYDPDSEVIWVKDGYRFSNGHPPEGLTLVVNMNLAEQLSAMAAMYGEDLIYHLEGLYHCEVWGIRPFVRAASDPALLKLEGIYCL